MKKSVIFIICIVAIIIAVFTVKYFNFKAKQSEIKEDNLQYEFYLNKQILGTELTSIINKAVDNNEKNEVKKDEQGFYIDNEENSVRVDIKIIDNDTLYKMETLYNGGMTNFVQYYNSINFECTKIKYNKLGKVKYLYFEQKTV